MITRDLDAASRREFDLVVIGGGIYGVSVLREAARRGLSACLCEAADFGRTGNEADVHHARGAKREVVLSHAATGGPRGLFSVSGVKWTTASDVTRQVLALAGLGRVPARDNDPLPLFHTIPELVDAVRFIGLDDDSARACVQRVAAAECVHCVDDFVLRCTNWATTQPAPLASLRVNAPLKRCRYLVMLSPPGWEVHLGRGEGHNPAA